MHIYVRKCQICYKVYIFTHVKVIILQNNLFGKNLNPTTFHILTVLVGSVLIVVVVILLLTKL